MKTGERRAVTLSDGTEVWLRKVNQLDHWDARQIDDNVHRAMFLLSRAAIEPRIEVRGQPSRAMPNGVIHALDLDDKDLDLLLRELTEFALGGARREQFREGGEGGSPAGGPGGAEVREAPARDSAASE